DRGIAEIVDAMADGNGNALLAQLLDHVAVGEGGALYLVAELIHDLGDSGHANADNADEMDRADIGAHRLHHAGTPPAGAAARLRGSRTAPTAHGARPPARRFTQLHER